MRTTYPFRTMGRAGLLRLHCCAFIPLMPGVDHRSCPSVFCRSEPVPATSYFWNTGILPLCRKNLRRTTSLRRMNRVDFSLALKRKASTTARRFLSSWGKGAPNLLVTGKEAVQSVRQPTCCRALRHRKMDISLTAPFDFSRLQRPLPGGNVTVLCLSAVPCLSVSAQRPQSLYCPRVGAGSGPPPTVHVAAFNFR